MVSNKFSLTSFCISLPNIYHSITEAPTLHALLPAGHMFQLILPLATKQQLCTSGVCACAPAHMIG